MRFELRGDTYVLSFRRNSYIPDRAPAANSSAGRKVRLRMETTAYLLKKVGNDYQEVSHATARAYFKDQPTREQGRVQALKHLLPFLAPELRGKVLFTYYSRRRGQRGH